MRDATIEELLQEAKTQPRRSNRRLEQIFAEIDALERAAGQREPIDALQLIHETREERDQQLDEVISRHSQRTTRSH
jgi:hypothetical protein